MSAPSAESERAVNEGTKLSRCIARLRKENGLSLTQVARRSSVSRGYLYLLENGENSPTVEILEKVAAVFGLGAGDLLVRAGYTVDTQDPNSSDFHDIETDVMIAQRYLTRALKAMDNR
jgi:transcriptional regulator with XRE-family HTH domain